MLKKWGLFQSLSSGTRKQCVYFDWVLQRSLLAEILFKECILFTLKQKWNDETSFPKCIFLLCNLAMSKKREEMLPSCRQWRYLAERLKVMISSKQWNFHCKILAVSGGFDCETLHPFLKPCPTTHGGRSCVHMKSDLSVDRNVQIPKSSYWGYAVWMSLKGSHVQGCCMRFPPAVKGCSFWYWLLFKY